ncbi:PAS domain S-box protein [Halomontanus rarus]|uniref:PAS domain S-box protein n=1 Tax=Halomontanus rarus TaxID=3034020 RepID=UPI0023E82E63|nr:PAS domain S-box protein [Halovivax sp. TS33]
MSTRPDATEGAFWGDANADVALQRYRTLVNTVDDGIYQLDAAGRFVAINDIIVEMTGYTRDELLGEHVSLVLEDNDIDRITRRISECLANEKELNETFEFTAQTVDDRSIPCELRMSLLVEDGSFDGTIGIIREISERKQAEQTIDEREQQLQRERDLTNRILETSPVAIQVLDRDGEVMRMNERAKELLEIDDVETYLPSDRAVYDEDGAPVPIDEHPFAHVLESGGPVYDRVLEVELPSGNHRWLSVNAAPILSDDDELDRVVTTGEDVSKIKERERKLESELREILGRISDAFYALDEEWRFTHINDRAAEFLGYPKEKLRGQVIWDVFPGAVGSEFQNCYQEAMATQEPVSFEWYSDMFDSWEEVNIYPSETGLSVYFRDITERKEREQELTKYETIVETINDGIYVKDDTGHFTMVNGAYADLTGYSCEELVGEHASLVVDEDTIEQAEVKRKVMADDDMTNQSMEAMIQTADGNQVPAEATFATFQTNGDKKQIGVVRDISDRKEQRRKLEKSERRYRTLAESFPNGIVTMFDTDLQYTLAAGRGFDKIPVEPSDLEGQYFWNVWGEDTVSTLEPAFTAVLEGDEQSVELSYADREWVVHAIPITDDQGEIFAGVTMAHDITERKEYQRKLEETIEQLEESNKRLEQFAYAASHDLQEPLRMVSSYLQLIERRYGDKLDEDGEEFLEFAVDGADRMREMIEGLLTYSRIETRGEPLEPVELDAVLKGVLEDLQIRIEETNATITTERLPCVEGDASQLRQVFQNLLSNAITYCGDEPPRVHVDAERREREWVISVRDEGIGIDPDDQDRVFEVFQRLHSREEHSGTGIGLALCQRIVERHHGELWAESELDKGSTFSFTLPRAQPHDT